MWTTARSMACLLAVSCFPREDLSSYSSGYAEATQDAGGAASRSELDGASRAGSSVAGQLEVASVGSDRNPPRQGDPDFSLVLRDGAPSISSVSPSDGVRGVSSDAVIVVTFSESMDTELVEAAFDSDDIDPDLAEFSWSESDRVLTIRPGAPLEYAEGEEPEVVEARPYAYQFSSIARDLTGNGLTPTAFSFFTLRKITRKLSASADRSQTGNWTSQGLNGQSTCDEDAPFVCVGDGAVATDAQYKGFLTFDLQGLDAEVPIGEARLRLAVASLPGRAFQTLGELSLEQLEFSAIDDSAFSDPTIETLAKWSAISENVLSADVSESLKRQAATGAAAQYRLSFDLPTNADGAADLVMLDRDGLELLVSQLVP